MISVLFVCHGNICRSTMAESVFTHKVKTLGPSDQFLIDSFATKYRGDWESTSQRNSEQAERSGNTTGSAQSEADYVGGL